MFFLHGFMSNCLFTMIVFNLSLNLYVYPADALPAIFLIRVHHGVATTIAGGFLEVLAKSQEISAMRSEFGHFASTALATASIELPREIGNYVQGKTLLRIRSPRKRIADPNANHRREAEVLHKWALRMWCLRRVCPPSWKRLCPGKISNFFKSNAARTWAGGSGCLETIASRKRRIKALFRGLRCRD